MPVSNLLPFSWLTDTIIWVNEIDQTFYDSIPKLKYAYAEMYPSIHFGGSLIAAKIVNNSYTPQRKALQLFTGGVDATTTLLRILDKKPLLVNTFGWFSDDIDEDNSQFKSDQKAIQQFAATNDLDSVFCRSNFATFILPAPISKLIRKYVRETWFHGFQHSVAFLGCAAVIGYHYKVSTMYIASSYTFGQNTTCASDPRIDSQFSCASLRTIHDGYELSRQQKVQYILSKQRDMSQRFNLRVCSFQNENCCSCEKCLRTMLAIVAEGGDVAQLGFSPSKNLLDSLKDFLAHSIMEIDPLRVPLWEEIIDRMAENKEHISELQVYEFLSTFDFPKNKRKYLLKYYTSNFFPIIKRKLLTFFRR